MNHPYRTRCALGLGVLLLAACGGGGGGGGSNATAPTSLAYEREQAIYTSGVEIEPNAATVDVAPVSFSVTPALPAGLALDADSGELTGTPTTPAEGATYVVRAANAAGEVTAELWLAVAAPARTTYAANRADSTLSIFGADPETGELQPRGYVPAAAGHGEPAQLATHPAGGLLVSANAASDDLTLWSVDPVDGWLAAVEHVAVGAGPHHLAFGPGGDFLYVACEGSDELHAFAVDTQAPALTAVGAPLGVPAEPSALAVDLERGRLFLASRGANSDITVYGLDAQTGAATALGAPTMLLGGLPNALALAPDGEHLYALLAAFQIVLPLAVDEATGALAIVPPGSRTEVDPRSIVVHPLGTHLYASNAGSDSITVYSIDPATGVLTVLGHPPTGSTPTALAMDPAGGHLHVVDAAENVVTLFRINPANGGLVAAQRTRARQQPAALASVRGDQPAFPAPRFALVTGSESDDLTSYTVDPVDGALAQSGLPALAGMDPRCVAVDPRGRFAYVASAESATLSGFAIDPADGTLTELGLPLALTGQEPSSLAVEPSGRFLYVVERDQGFLTVFALDPTSGVPSQVTTFQVGIAPAAVAVEPTGQFLYVANEGDGPGTSAISVMRIPVVTGVPTPSAPPVFVPGPSQIAFHPTGRFAYALQRTVNDVSPYRMDAFSGQLDAVGSVAPAGDLPSGVVVHPNGRFAYVAYEGTLGDGHVTLFPVNPNTGMFGSPQEFSDGSGPSDLAVDPSGRFLYVANRGSDDVSLFTIDGETGVLTTELPTASGLQPSSIEIVGGLQ